MIFLLLLILVRALDRISISRPNRLIIVLRSAGSCCHVCLRLLGPRPKVPPAVGSRRGAQRHSKSKNWRRGGQVHRKSYDSYLRGTGNTFGSAPRRR